MFPVFAALYAIATHHHHDISTTAIICAPSSTVDVTISTFSIDRDSWKRRPG
ncbi:hypothetical protein LXL04_012952 [Taraxacum kok-saghyz]